MVVHHATDWYVGNARSHLPGWDTFVVSDVAAVAFTMAAGASGVLFATALARKGWDGWRIDANTARRYGLLVPIGMALAWVLSRDAWHWGVLGVLGASVVVSTVIGRRVGALPLAVLGVVAVSASIDVVEAVGRGDAFAQRVLGPGFPLVLYTGLALLGAAAGRVLLHRPDQARSSALLGLGLLAVSAVAVATGRPPDRHPGMVLDYVVPGVGGTLVLYALVSLQPPRLVDAVLQRAGRHTLGIFLAHWGLYWILRELGALRQLDAGPGVALAVATALAFTMVAPFVPQLPWTPRTGRRRQPAPKTSASTSGTGRSSWA